ncbi:MAG: hypothetical protein V4436_00295, partial [Patescibacteria group bacterium]
IAWIEPEKYPVVPLLESCFDLITSGTHDIVLPTRKSLESYPMYQELSELRANRELGFITGRPELDFYFGLRVFNKKGAKLFLSYDGEGGDTWHIFFIPVLRAIANGSHLVGQTLVNYVHPAEQTAAEVGDAKMDRKRDHQREVLVSAMREEAERLGYTGLN